MTDEEMAFLALRDMLLGEWPRNSAAEIVSIWGETSTAAPEYVAAVERVEARLSNTMEQESK